MTQPRFGSYVPSMRVGVSASLVSTLVLAASLLGCGAQASGPMAVYDIEPRAGSAAGEQAVRITGHNFRQDIGYTVYFGASRAGRVTIMDTDTLLVATPQHDPGRVDIVVAADDGPAFKVVSGFEFQTAGGGGAAGGAPAARY